MCGAMSVKFSSKTQFSQRISRIIADNVLGIDREPLQYSFIANEGCDGCLLGQCCKKFSREPRDSIVMIVSNKTTIEDQFHG